MEPQKLVDTYFSLSRPQQKAELARLRDSRQDLQTVLALTRGPQARSAVRILTDLGGRIGPFIGDHISQILPLLRAEDAKVRMSAAQLIGDTCAAEHVDDLIEALEAEQTMYARPPFLLAIGRAKNKTAEDYLRSYSIRSDIDKHILEEKNALAKALSNFVRRETPHVRILPSDVIVVTTPNVHVTMEALMRAGMKPRKFGGDVAVTDLASFQQIYKVRAFETAYIYLGSCAVADLPEFLASRESAVIQRTHVKGYRLEVKSDSNEVRLDVIARCVAALTRLENSPSSYSIEIMIRIRDGRAQIFLNPLIDPRFAYRKKSIPASIHPGVAACVVSYASEFFNSDARVLDDFCGSGTLLFERAYYPYHTLTGVDISLGAIEAAKFNSRYAAAHPQFHYLDCLKFTARKYNEILTNMPFGLRVGSHQANVKLYQRYFEILPGILHNGGLAVLYTHEKRLTERLIDATPQLEPLKRTTFEAGGLYPAVFCLRRRHS
ncbi:MAG: methyltransferase [Clostridia bacterium]|nr:methyltransferase [Clostridia bacterium]